MSGGFTVDNKQPANFTAELPGADAIRANWLYTKEKPQLQLLVLSFYDGKLGSADLFTVNSPFQAK
jgi:hypothetical protein